ncbi:hypothetical protein LG409_02565 [Halomonas sp. NyZ770]|uniref:hypothetical protein n=1 Tax=Halomonas sp. NyZ770 TaxID=2883106 RepID=UPI001D0A0D33|nr:hypothetical protein [Halomonas sp. NyZ770]UDM07804.1 hypothetical protein LG409_02565 [Halomonas sp. NyZ770]
MEIGAAVTAVKGALDLARSARDVNDRAQLNAAMSDIMDKLTTAQSDLLELLTEHHRLVDENREMKLKLANEERFDQYRLKETQQGGFVLELKEEYVTEDNPKHAICQLCSQEGRLTPLNKDPQYYHCPRCRVATEHTYHDLPC